MAVASREAKRRIRAGEKATETELEPVVAADDVPQDRALLTVLVLQGLRLAEEEEPGTRALYVRDLAELEGLLKQAGRALEGLEEERAARGLSNQPLTADEKNRISQLEKTLRDLDKALKRMKHDREPHEREKGPPGPDKAGKKGPPKKGEKRERDDD
jgi:hypothetical protein